MKRTRVRLTAPAQVDGGLREPGYEFVLPLDADGKEMRGPHTSRRVSHDRIDVNEDSNRILGELVDEPLFEVVEKFDDAPAEDSEKETTHEEV
jgi:hypothetical protein